MARRDRHFWETAEDWSRRKHLVLGYYLTPAAAKLGSTNAERRVTVLDAFAGRGKYEDNAPGSPILLGQLTDTCAAWKNPVRLHIFNVEPDEDNYSELQQCTASWSEKGTVTNLHGTFQEHLGNLMKRMGQSPLVAFLDPFRPSHLLFDDFKPLLQRSGITELLFVFHTPAVIRMLQAASPQSRNSQARKIGLAKMLTQVFGHERWMDLWNAPEISPAAVVECFKGGLFEQASRGVWVRSTAIHARYRIGLKYHIVFLTRNEHGLRLMNDAFVKEARDAFSKDPSRSQLCLLTSKSDDTAAMAESTRIECLSDTLEEIGRENPDKTWVRMALCFELLTRHFGDFLQKEHLAAVNHLMYRTETPRIEPLTGHRFSTGRWRTSDDTLMKFIL